MRFLMAIAACAGLIMLATPSQAALMQFSYSGTITSGSTTGMFGQAAGVTANLVGQQISGWVRYDSAAFAGQTISTPNDGVFVNTATMVFSQTIGGHSFTFDAGYRDTKTVDDVGDAITFDRMRNRLLLANAVDHFYALAGDFSFKDGVRVPFDGTFGVGIQLPAGTITDPNDPAFTYQGAVTPGRDPGAAGLGNWENRTHYYTPGGPGSDLTDFRFVIDQASVAAVPEPASWGMMILGTGLIGATRRRRGHALQGARA